ncbi:acyltransferase [Sphingomonas sp. RT2P30]
MTMIDGADMRVAPAPDAAAKAPRTQAIELLRILACFGIVAFHDEAAFHDLAYAGLIAFLILSPFVDLGFNATRVRSPVALARALIVPWLFWLVFYGGLKVLRGYPFIPDGNVVLALLQGSTPHLWFLPFMFGVLVMLNAIKTRVPPAALFWPALLAAAPLFASAAWWRPLSAEWTPPLAQWMHAAPAVFAGIALGLAPRLAYGRAIAAALLLAALAIAAAAHLPGVSLTYPVGVIVTAIVAWWGGRLWPARWNVAPVARCTMGIYLSHIVWLSFVRHYTGSSNYLTVAVTFAAALASVWVARRFVPMTRLVLG